MKNLKMLSLALPLSFGLYAEASNQEGNYISGSEVVVTVDQRSDKELIESIKETMDIAHKAIAATESVTSSYKKALESAQNLVAKCGVINESTLMIADFREAYDRACKQSVTILEEISAEIARVVDQFPEDVKEYTQILENGKRSVEILIARTTTTKAYDNTLDDMSVAEGLRNKMHQRK